jgi:DNA-binding XRE family transcriptional regulator
VIDAISAANASLSLSLMFSAMVEWNHSIRFPPFRRSHDHDSRMHRIVCRTSVGHTGFGTGTVVCVPDKKQQSAEIAARFGQNLRRIRRRTGMSQEELGVRASLHRTEIGLLEHGERLARIDTLVKVASALSTTPNDLLEGIDWSVGDISSGRVRIGELSADAAEDD